MEYLQFGFAAVFCILLYTDQRTVIKNLTRALDKLTSASAEIMGFIREKDTTK